MSYKLDLTDYEVGKDTVEVRDELNQMLRLPGIYANGIETCDGVLLARDILKDPKATEIEIDETQLKLIRKVMNTLIARPHNPALGQVSLGGVRYEEMILRVFTLDKK